MRLEDYWGVGPKTRTLLADSLGVEAAIEAIERGDVRALVDAGLPRGRATRILRHAHGGAAMDLLATRDARAVYKELLDLAVEHAVTPDAADRIRILTPLADPEAMADRLRRIEDARTAWRDLDDRDREALIRAFERDGSAAGTRADLGAVRSARAIQDLGPEGAVFDPILVLDADALSAAEGALAGFAGSGERVGEGADDRLDDLRAQLGAVEDLAAAPGDVLATVREGAQATDDLRESLAREIAGKAGVDASRVRDAMPRDATDAADFVESTLRDLAGDLRSAVDEREKSVAETLEADLAAARGTVDDAVSAVEDLGLLLSLARFAAAYDLAPPTLLAERDTIAMVGGRNLSLVASGEDVQPVTYAVGDHDLPVASANDPPRGDRVAVLTGANSGGKTTLLETVCQVQLLAQMGLPVPAEAAQVSPVDDIVFHRRHASFNAGVLEATLRTVVPPLTDQGRTLMLVDEFEAITEPGAAADLLHGLVTMTVDAEALGVFVTHLAADLEPLPAVARIDGIFAEGLTPELALEVDYQPRFGTVGRSTPEFIISRLVAEASDRAERTGYRALAEAVGEEAVQRTLADARWGA
ncbi:MAG: DNA mismatch repair protein [Haloarculaceae archaeon]